MSRFSIKTAMTLAASALISISVVGCGGSKVTNDNLKKITTGMTEQQVEDILGGKPTTTAAAPAGVTGSVETWTDGGKSISVTVLGGKVVAGPVGSGL